MWGSSLISRQIAKRAVASCLLLLGTTVSAAPDLDADKRTISLREAVTRTIQHNPDLRAFDYQLKAQEGRVMQAGRAPSPELNLELEDVLGTGAHRGIDSAQTTLSIGWVLERGVRQRHIDAASTDSGVR